MSWRITILSLLLVLGGDCTYRDLDRLDQLIDDLQHRTANSQIKESVSGLGALWEMQKGVYPCNIRNNFVGTLEAEEMRDAVAIFDNNAFVTAWVSIILLEASRVKKGPSPSDQQLELALEALATYHDNNSPPGDGSMVFWPQAYNSSVKQWYCHPVNVEKVGRDADKFLSLIHKVLDDVHLEKLWEKGLSSMQGVLESELSAFHIPPDFDDMSVNVGLGSLLSTYAASPVPFQRWQGNNTNFTQMFKAMKKYAYRPFGTGDTAVIDPRTYFAMRKYFLSLDKNYPAAFVTTWAHTISEDYGTRFSFGMPFHVNNIDLTVGTNAIYGITSAILSNLADPKDWFDQDVQAIYENTTDLITYLISQNFSSRPDIALTYYPSVYNFYWFTSRTYHILRTFTSAGHSLPYSVLSRVMNRLGSSLRGNVTADLLKGAIKDEDGSVYFEDFLGNDDRNILGEKVKHGEDRICSTAMAINALLFTWTTEDKFDPQVPSSVKEAVANASIWLMRNVMSIKAYSVVFSGSVKSKEDLPLFYPLNFMKYLNGSDLPPSVDPTFVGGVKSLIPEEEYAAMLKKKHFGMSTPVDFYGYNQDSFPFWSSKPFTYASAMLALSQYRALLDSGQL